MAEEQPKVEEVPKPEGEKAEQKPEGEVKHMRQKKEKKPKKQVEKPPEPDPASFIDARIGRIVKVAPVPNSDFLYEEEVDIGNGQVRHIVSSIRSYYTVEQLQDRKIVIFTNMHPAKMCGVTSEAMLFAGSTPEPDVCELLDPPADAPVGERVHFGQFTGDGEVQGIDKRNNKWKKCLPFLRINAEGIATYKDEPLRVAEGVITVPNIRNCEFH